MIENKEAKERNVEDETWDDQGFLSCMAENPALKKFMTAAQMRCTFANSIGIPFAGFGFLNPIFAAQAMALSSLSVIANSTLLKRARLGTKTKEATS